MRRLRKGDEVIVISGRHKGDTGEVLAIDKDNKKVKVKGINIVKRHKKGDQKSTGEILEIEAMMSEANVALWDSKAKQIIKVGFKITKDGEKHRVNRKSGELIG